MDIFSGLRIRGAESSDLAALAQIAADREGTPQTTQHKLFEKHLLNQKTHQSMILVADVRDEVVSFGNCAYCKVPDGAPANHSPDGCYLTGVIVSPKFRRRKVGHQLTHARLQWIARRASKAYYFASAQNRVTIELHRQFGFVEVTRDFSFPKATFSGGEGILFEIELSSLRTGDGL